MADHFAAIKNKAEENIRKWLYAKHSRPRLANGKIEEIVGPCILVPRETGAGGGEFARMGGRKFGWDVHNNEIVDYLAAECGTSRSLIEIADERDVTWIEGHLQVVDYGTADQVVGVRPSAAPAPAAAAGGSSRQCGHCGAWGQVYPAA